MEVIFLHGLGQGPSAWEGVVSALPDSIRADCPDLFALAKGGTLDYPALYRGFSAFCGEKREGLHLCGLSLGAVLALQYAQEHPESVKSLVLIGGRVRTPKALLKVQNALFHLMGEKNFREMGLTPEPMEHVRAPGILESPVNLECRVTQVIPLGSHQMFLAEILGVKIDAGLLDEKGKFHLNQSRLAASILNWGKDWENSGFPWKRKNRNRQEENVDETGSPQLYADRHAGVGQKHHRGAAGQASGMFVY